MLRHAALVLGLIGGMSGCKGLGGLASGLGHVAGGLARAVPKVAAGAARALPAVAKSAAHVAPLVAHATLRAVPAVVRAVDVIGAIETSPDVVVEVDGAIETSPDVVDEVAAPADPCDACPPTRDCNQCTGYGGSVCTAVETSCVSP